MANSENAPSGNTLSREQQNQRNLIRLRLAISSSFGQLNLLIAVCDNLDYRNELIQTYEAKLTEEGFVCHQRKLDKSQPSLKDALLRVETEGEAKTVVTILGADELLGVRLDESKSELEKFFFSVQWTREGLREFKFPVVIWVTERVAAGLTEASPDFWSWRGGVFEFSRPFSFGFPQAPDYFQKFRGTVYDPNPIGDPQELSNQIDVLLQDSPNSPLLGSLYYSLGKIYADRLEQGKAVNYQDEQRKAVSAFEEAIDRQKNESSNQAQSLSALANLFKQDGRYQESEPLFQKALSIREQEFGIESIETARSLNDIGTLYSSVGRYQEAEALLKRAFFIREQQLSIDDPNTAISLNNLAVLYQIMGRYTDTEPLFQRALSIREQQLGANHPKIAESLNNLAALYQILGRYLDAEPLYKQALSINEQQLGIEHPNTATSLANLAALYQSMGRYSDAEPLYKRALLIHKQQLGANHLSTVSTLNNLAIIYQATHRYEAAEKLYLQSLEVNQLQSGYEHPSTVGIINDLGILYCNMGNLSKGEKYLNTALLLRKKILPEGHPHILVTQKNLGQLEQQTGKKNSGKILNLKSSNSPSGFGTKSKKKKRK
jgi:tetratricopeptide (TPR) repeat protein